MTTHIELTAAPTTDCSGAATVMMPAERAECLAEIFKALSDPTRVRLLAYVSASADGTACACHLPDALGISQPTLSHHLKKLTYAGLITRQQRGRWAHYAAVPGVLEVAREFLGASTEAAARCC